MVLLTGDSSNAELPLLPDPAPHGHCGVHGEDHPVAVDLLGHRHHCHNNALTHLVHRGQGGQVYSVIVRIRGGFLGEGGLIYMVISMEMDSGIIPLELMCRELKHL